MNEIKVLIVEPEKLPYEKTIPNTLEAKQEIVDGLIECAYLNSDPEIVIICNEEGKLLNLPLNRNIDYDIIAGTFLIVGDDEENFKSLTDEQIEKYKKTFGKESIIINKKNEINDEINF